MADYSKTAANALKSIAKAGKKFQIFRSSPTFNQQTGLPTATATQSGEITAVVLPRYKGQTFNSLDDSLKQALVRGQLKSLLAAGNGAPFKPGPLDYVMIDGEQWRVIGCTTLAPDGATPIIYTIGIHLGPTTPTTGGE